MTAPTVPPAGRSRRVARGAYFGLTTSAPRSVFVPGPARSEGGEQETRGRSHVLNNVPTKIPDQFCAEIHILLSLEHEFCIEMSTAYGRLSCRRMCRSMSLEEVKEEFGKKSASSTVASFVALPPVRHRPGYRITSSPTLSPTMTNAMVAAQCCRDLLQ
jgi:hypothetical protein